MSRIPSLHITEKQLEVVLENVLDNIQDDPDVMQSPLVMARMIVREAKKYSVAHRSISVTNDKLDKKVEKLKLSNRSDTGLFAQLLLMIRRKLKHRGLQLIKPGENDWFLLKEVCNLATEFCNEFEIDKKDGYKNYIEIGMSKMKNFSIPKFKSLHSAICNIYEAKIELEGDKTPEATNQCYLTYIGTINEKIGHSFEDYKNIPEKYVCFKKAVDSANLMGLKPPLFIKAQFWAVEYRNGIPDPAQLYGEKAIQNARKYCFEHNIQVSMKTKVIDFSKIRKR